MGAWRPSALARYVTCGTVFMLLAGTSYSWSLFLVSMEADLGWSRATLSLANTAGLWGYALGNVLSGALSNKVPYKWMLLIASSMMGGGYILSSAMDAPLALYLCYGGLRGVGCGMINNTVLGTVHRFSGFKTGAITGLLLLALGMSSTLLGPVIALVNQAGGWRLTFKLLGGLSLALLGACAIAMPRAHWNYAGGLPKTPDARPEHTTKAMLKAGTFWAFFLWSMIMYLIGQSYISFAAACGADIRASAAVSTLMVGLFSLSNGLGRLAFGKLFGALPMKTVMRLSTSVAALGAALAALGAMAALPTIMLPASALVGLGYAGLMVANPMVIRRYYGSGNFAMNYSIICLTGVPSAALSVAYMNGLHDATGSYALAFAIFCALALISLILVPGKEP